MQPPPSRAHLHLAPPPAWDSLSMQPPPSRAHLHLAPPPAWDSLLSSIKQLSSRLLLSPAFAAYSSLRLHYPSPPASLLPLPLLPLLLCSSSLRALPQGLQLHAHLLSLGLLSHPRLLSLLASLYSPSLALSLLISSPSLHPLPWNSLISSLVRNGLFTQALHVYDDHMLKKGVRPDAFTYPSVLKACGEIGELGLGRNVQNRLENDGLGSNLFACNALVSMYARCGEVDEARKVFDGMPERDEVSWNAMISGYAVKEMWAEAAEVFERMRKEGTGVNVVTWNTVAGGYLQMGRFREALQLVGEARRGLDHVTFVIGLRACSQIGCMRLGREIHGIAIRVLHDKIDTVQNALITMYSRCREMNCAYILFQTAEIRSVVTWNCMITGYCSLDLAEEALSLFREMAQSGVSPNFVTVVTVLSLCARVADLQHGKELHCCIIRRELGDQRLLWNALVDMYSKSGRVAEARSVFESMRDRDEVSYTSLIAGYGMRGDGLAAVELFNEMILLGLRPDHVSMVSVLSACSHSGLVKEGQKLFDNIISGCYGIVPLMEHYSCMIDLYSRAGMLEKAEEFLGGMPLQPTAEMWASVVGACHVYNNMKIGERAATKLLETATGNPGHYVLVANIYAAAGNWGELAKVRTLMRDIHLKKIPGLAWVDIGNGFHPFLVEDRYHARWPEIYTLMDVLSEHIRDDGRGCMELDEESDL